MKSTEAIDKLRAQVEKGRFVTEDLRANIQDILALVSGDYLRVSDLVGHPIVYCDSCGKVNFAIHTKTAYSGACWVCRDCAEKYTYCDPCKTLVLIDDITNPTHVHENGTVGRFGYIEFPVEQPVAVFNADVMANGGKFYKTQEEEKVLKHRKVVSTFPERPFRNFGVELEVEKLPGGPPDLLSRTRKIFGKFVMVKHDGSLSRHGKGGFEIVSMPATMAYHKSGVWTSFFQHLGPFFQEAPDSTGLHIHIGLNTLSPLTVDKMLLFVNVSENREFIYGMANRNLLRPNPNGRLYANVRGWGLGDMMKLKQHNGDCPWHPNNRESRNYYKLVNGQVQYDPWGNPIIGNINGDPATVRATCKCQEGHYNIDHYEAVNLRTHRPTVELRIFRGIMNESFLYACLEFSDSLADFCTVCPMDELHFKNYLDFLKDKTKRYKNLYRLLVNQCWIDPPKDKHKTEELTKVPVYGLYA